MMEGAPDEPRIPDGEILLRRVREDETTYDENLHRNRPSSQAFLQNGSDGPTSVYLNAETTPAAVMSEGAEEFLVSVIIDVVRENGLDVMRDHTSGGLGHCVITGKKSRAALRAISRAAVWVEGYGPG